MPALHVVECAQLRLTSGLGVVEPEARQGNRLRGAIWFAESMLSVPDATNPQHCLGPLFALRLDAAPAFAQTHCGPRWFALDWCGANTFKALPVQGDGAAISMPSSVLLTMLWLFRQVEIHRAVVQRDLLRVCAILKGWLGAARRLPGLSALDPEPRPRRQQRLARIEACLGRSLTPAIPIGAVAEEVHLSVAQLNRVLRRSRGLSAGRYRRELRLRTAAMRLLAGTDRCGDIAHAVGYRSASQFSADFMQSFGQPPSRWVVSLADFRRIV